MMDEQRLREQLEQLADPPADVAGVAEHVLDRLATSPGPGGGPAGSTGGIAGHGGWIAAMAAAVAIAVVAGVLLGRVGDAPGTERASVDLRSTDVAAVSFRDCPDGAAIGGFGRGDRVLVVARDRSGEWLAVRHPDDRSAQAWVPTVALIPDGDLEGIPVGGCEERGELAFVLPGGETITSLIDEPDAPGAGPAPGEAAPPGEPGQPATPGAPGNPSPTPPTTARPGPGPGPAPGPGPTTPPTTPPDTTGPSITGPSVQPGAVWETFAGLCLDKPKTATIAATVSDASGVATVTARWTLGNNQHAATMSHVANSVYQAAFGPYPYLSVPDGASVDIVVTITATDTKGNSTVRQTTVRLHSAGTCFG